MAFPTLPETTLPETWAWDEHDMLITDDEALAAVAARRAEIIHNQIESFDAEALPWQTVESDCGA